MGNDVAAIHQFSPDLSYGDAISNYAIELMKLLRSWGYHSEIYVVKSDSQVAKYCKSYHAYHHHPQDILIYHYGIASEMTSFLINWPERLVLIYHGITPPHFFQEDYRVFDLLNKTREDLCRLNVVPCAIGDSSHNCQELAEFGFKDVQTLPVLLNLNNLDTYFDAAVEQQIFHQWGDDYVNLLFIGRLAPNKRQDDLIRFLSYYQKLISPRIRLLLIGSASISWYKTFLEVQAHKLGVAEDVHFIGHLKLKDGFASYYKVATVFLSMSEHEGFGIPLLESMYFDLPVIAYAAAAVPETMGDAGILLKEKRYDVIGELVTLLATDPSLREKIINQQRKRLRSFERPHQERLFRDWVSDLEKRFS